MISNSNMPETNMADKDEAICNVNTAWINDAKARHNTRNSEGDKMYRYWDYCTALDAMNKKLGVICSYDEIIQKARSLPHCSVTNAYSKTVESTDDIVNAWNIEQKTIKMLNRMTGVCSH